MGARVDLAGVRFGRWIAICATERRSTSGSLYWFCRCDCGGSGEVDVSTLRRGGSQSCGCLFLEVAAAKGRANRRHGMTESSEYNAWVGMRDRCNNPNSPKFSQYGGRGIKVCDRWQSFEAFYADMGPRPSPAYSVDRIDVNGDYEPSNCRWATQKEQQSNRRDNVFIEWRGERRTVTDWERVLGVGKDAIARRVRRGMSGEKAVEVYAR